MRYTIGRLHLTSLARYREPYLQLPGRATDVLEGYYKALHPRYVIELKDLQTFGGTSFGDLKLVVNALGGRAKIEVNPAGMAVEFGEATRETDDLSTIRDFVVIAEDTLRAKLAGVVVQQRVIRGAGWLRVEEGKDAIEQMLQERGDAALKMSEGPYKGWVQQYTLEVNLSDERGKQLAMVLQRSGVPEYGELFVRCDYVVTDRGEGLMTIGEDFDQAFIDFEGLLRHVGLEPKVE